jgi:4-amino-4-deoxychorismate lyase
MLVNGVLSDSINANDRGLLYGDGVFRTMRLSQGKILHWPRHYQKLQQDCAALLLDCPDSSLLAIELQQLIADCNDGVVKIIITRGQGGQGYAQPGIQTSSRILRLVPPPKFPEYFRTKGIKVHVCNLRLAHQPRLAGIKHLNRLENVLAAAEWNDTDVAEGILLDAEGNVIEGTRSNLFMISNGVLLTPALSRCGVAGMQRERVLDWAVSHGMPYRIEQFDLSMLLVADEIFLVNSVIGLWPVNEMLTRIWTHCPIAGQIQKWLEQEVV